MSKAPKDDPPQDERTIRPFADWMNEQRKGATHAELSTALNDMLTAVRDHGKKGSLTFTVTAEPMKDNSEVLVINDKIVVKRPEAKRKGSVYFIDDDGNPRRDNPNQMTFEGLRDVSDDERPADAAERAAGDDK